MAEPRCVGRDGCGMRLRLRCDLGGLAVRGEWLVQKLASQPGETVLDLAAGAGDQSDRTCGPRPTSS